MNPLELMMKSRMGAFWRDISPQYADMKYKDGAVRPLITKNHSHSMVAGGLSVIS